MANSKAGSSTQRSRGRFGVILGMLSVIVITGGIVALSDVGGNTVLSIATRFLREQTGLELTAEKITGNPIRGYTVYDMAILAGTSGLGSPDNSNQKLFSAKSLSASVSLKALLKATLRLSELSIGGVDMDLDQFLAEVQKIRLPLAPDNSSKPGGKFQVPIDRVSLSNSRFTSKWGQVDIKTVGANIHDSDLAVDLDTQVNNIPVTGTIDMDVTSGTTIAIKKSNVSFGQAKIFVTGGIAPLSEIDTTTALNLQGAIQGLNLQELSALWRDLKPQDYDGTADVNIEANGTIAGLRISSSLDYKGRFIAGYPVERVRANVDYSGGRISITNIHANALNVPISGSAAIEMPSGLDSEKMPSILLYLDGSDASLDGVIAGLGGRVSSFGIRIEGPINQLSGTVNLALPLVAYQNAKVSNIAAQLKLSKGNTATINSKFQFEGAQGYLQGTITPLLNLGADLPQMNLTAKLVKLDLRNLSRLARQLAAKPIDYDMTGSLDMALFVKGPISEPNISGSLNSSAIKANSSAGAINLVTPAINFAVTGIHGFQDIQSANLELQLDASAKSLSLVSQAKKQPKSPKSQQKAQNQEITLSNIAANVQGTTQSFKLNSFKLNLVDLGGTEVTATGEGRLSNNLSAKLNIQANKLNFEPLIATFASDIPEIIGQLSGQANLSLNLDIADIANTSGVKVTGTGTLKSGKTKAWGVTLSDVTLPLAFEYISDKNNNTFTSKGGTANFYGGKINNSLALTFDTGVANADKFSFKFNNELNADNVDVNALIHDMTGGLEGNITGRGQLAMMLNGGTGENANTVTYNGSGQFNMGSGAITGFKIPDIIARIHGTQGLKYANVTAPFEIQPGRLILKSGAIANAVDNDPMYKYVKLGSDGVIGFDTSLNLPIEAVANYQLINALIGGGKGTIEGISDVLKGKTDNLKESLNAILGGGLSGAQKQGGRGDYRDVKLKVFGTFNSPSIRDLYIGPSTLPREQEQDSNNSNIEQDSKQEIKQEQKTPTEVLKDVLLNGAKEIDLNKKPTEILNDLLRKDNSNTKPETPKTNQASKSNTVPPVQPRQPDQPNKNIQEQLENRLKEELNNQLQKGFGSLFKR